MAKNKNGRWPLRQKARLTSNAVETQSNDYFLFNNLVLVQGFAMLPLISGATTLKSAVILTLGALALMIPIRLIGDLTARMKQKRLRVLLYVLFASVLIVPVMILFSRWLGGDVAALGLYLPLLCLDPIVIWRGMTTEAEGRNVLYRTFTTCAGFSVVMVIIGALREFLSSGSLWGTPIMVKGIWSAANTAPGGLLLVALLAVLWKWLGKLLLRVLYIGSGEVDHE